MLRRLSYSLAMLAFVWVISFGGQAGIKFHESALSERRLALVIGNSAYDPSIGSLPSPINDAHDVATALEAVGFEVTLKLDLNRDQMRRAMIDFERSLRKGAVGLFYFSGHAVQLRGNNYLLPLGAEIHREGDVEFEGIGLDEILTRMAHADNRWNIVILDACRNNPYPSISRGLTRIPALSGTYIAYCAAPGQVALDGSGRNSPYTAALVRALDEPGLSIEDVFTRVRADVARSTSGTQIPSTASSHTGDFYFRPPEPQVAEPVTTASASDDLIVWSAIASSQDPANFEAFLEAYPDSALAMLARARLDKLRAPASQPGAAAPKPAVPQFPWPPPRASGMAVIPTEFVRLVGFANPTLGDLADHIQAALDIGGYFERSYYAAPGGFAVVTRLEQINPDGTPKKDEAERWAVEARPIERFSLGAYLRALFAAPSGYYRIIVFVVSSQPFAQSEVEVDRKDVIAWLHEGLNRLPDSVGHVAYTDDYAAGPAAS